MPDILHRVGIKSPADKVYRALTTRDGLASWWTDDTQVEGNIIAFRFGERGFIDMKVLDHDQDRRVTWQVVDGPEDWIGSKVGFDLRQDGDQTVVLFGHRGWKEASEFMHHCSTKWGSFLMSLKSAVETGKGAPFPEDVHVAVDWP